MNVSFVGSKALATRDSAPKGRGVGISQVVPFPWNLGTPVVKEYQQLFEASTKKQDYSFTSLEGFIAAKMLVEGLRRAGARPDAREVRHRDGNAARLRPRRLLGHLHADQPQRIEIRRADGRSGRTSGSCVETSAPMNTPAGFEPGVVMPADAARTTRFASSGATTRILARTRRASDACRRWPTSSGGHRRRSPLSGPLPRHRLHRHPRRRRLAGHRRLAMARPALAVPAAAGGGARAGGPRVPDRRVGPQPPLLRPLRRARCATRPASARRNARLAATSPIRAFRRR